MIKQSVYWNHVGALCKEFLEAYFGKEDSDPEKKDLGLRLACLGNPEKTIQGELVHYLRSKKLKAVSECAARDCSVPTKKGKFPRRNLDVLVLDDDWKEPVCAIELKHYSANQGSVLKLSHDLQKDLKRHEDSPGKGLPLIQLGLFTEIHYVRPDPSTSAASNAYGLYRFFRTYYRKECSTFALGEYSTDKYGKLLVTPKLVDMTFDSGSKAKGRVRYILSPPHDRSPNAPSN